VLTLTLIVVLVLLVIWPNALWRLEAIAQRRTPGLYRNGARFYHRLQADLNRRYPKPPKPLP
jgi:hypothetical protein